MSLSLNELKHWVNGAQMYTCASLNRVALIRAIACSVPLEPIATLSVGPAGWNHFGILSKCHLLNVGCICISSLTHWPMGICVKFLINYFPVNLYDWWCISCEIALRWLSLDLTDHKSTLVQVMAWQKALTWANIDPVLCHHTTTLGHNEF